MRTGRHGMIRFCPDISFIYRWPCLMVLTHRPDCFNKAWWCPELATKESFPCTRELFQTPLWETQARIFVWSCVVCLCLTHSYSGKWNHPCLAWYNCHFTKIVLWNIISGRRNVPPPKNIWSLLPINKWNLDEGWHQVAWRGRWISRIFVSWNMSLSTILWLKSCEPPDTHIFYFLGSVSLILKN